jgi:chromosome segregation ATPase
VEDLPGSELRVTDVKEKNKSIKELKEENEVLKKTQDNHDDELAELDIKLRESESELNKCIEKLSNLQMKKKKKKLTMMIG